MRILITGASGFVGKNLFHKLTKTNHDLIILHRGNIGSNKEASVKFIDLRDAEWMQQVKLENPEVVIHLAAFLTSLDDELSATKLVDANILFGTQLLAALRECPLKYFINTGTFAEYYHNDENLEAAYLYAALKTAFRTILAYYQSGSSFKIINVIPFTIYGGKDSKKKLIDYIHDSIIGEEWIKMSPGEQQLDFIHIDDVVSFYLALIEQLSSFKEPFTEIRLGSGIGTSPKQIASIFEKLTGKQAKIIWGGLPYRQKDTMYSVANRNLPEQYINWNPSIDIEKGIKDYIVNLEDK